jgi:hypothetical protein
MKTKIKLLLALVAITLLGFSCTPNEIVGNYLILEDGTIVYARSFAYLELVYGANNEPYWIYLRNHKGTTSLFQEDQKINKEELIKKISRTLEILKASKEEEKK